MQWRSLTIATFSAVAEFDQYRDKIIHVVLDSLPESPDAWVRSFLYLWVLSSLELSDTKVYEPQI